MSKCNIAMNTCLLPDVFSIIKLPLSNKKISPIKLFNSSVGRLVPSNLAFTEADASQIKSFIEAILFFCESKTNCTRICGMNILVIVLPKCSGSTVLFIYLFFFNVDNLQILRYCKKLKNTIAYHIANLRQLTKYIIHTNINKTYKHTSVRINCNQGFK